MFKFFQDILYPRRCPVCDDIVVPKGELSCPSCKNSLTLLNKAVCFKCGRKINSLHSEFCSSCSQYPRSFDKAYSLWEYDSIMKTSISNFKYKGRREFADFYASEMFRHFEKTLLSLDISAVVPVPLHKDRFRTRGFNQAELIAEILSKKLDIPVITDYLIRPKNTTAQKKLDFNHRRNNLSGAFSINKSSPYYDCYIKNILLIDDIYTTGSTADACADTLKKAGTDKVYVLCIASVAEG